MQDIKNEQKQRKLHNVLCSNYMKVAADASMRWWLSMGSGAQGEAKRADVAGFCMLCQDSPRFGDINTEWLIKMHGVRKAVASG